MSDESVTDHQVLDMVEEELMSLEAEIQKPDANILVPLAATTAFDIEATVRVLEGLGDAPISPETAKVLAGLCKDMAAAIKTARAHRELLLKVFEYGEIQKHWDLDNELGKDHPYRLLSRIEVVRRDREPAVLANL